VECSAVRRTLVEFVQRRVDEAHAMPCIL
jgi:hypothetical protein